MVSALVGALYTGGGAPFQGTRMLPCFGRRRKRRSYHPRRSGHISSPFRTSEAPGGACWKSPCQGAPDGPAAYSVPFPGLHRGPRRDGGSAGRCLAAACVAVQALRIACRVARSACAGRRYEQSPDLRGRWGRILCPILGLPPRAMGASRHEPYISWPASARGPRYSALNGLATGFARV